MTTTSPRPGSVRSAQRGGDVVSRRREFRRREFGWLARAGLVARGVVYGIVGILAPKLAIGSGGKATTQRGALMTLAHEPFGQALLIATAVGLAGYALWRLVRAGIGHGTEQRGFAAIGVFGHLALIGFAAYSIADARYTKI